MNEQEKLIKLIKNRDSITVNQAFYEETDFIVWHMVYKREIENYLPKEIIQNISGITVDNQRLIDGLSPQEYDFIDFEVTLSEIEVKKVFPPQFVGEWTRDLIERRCNHHLVDIELPNNTLTKVSEIEQILLKIAKII